MEFQVVTEEAVRNLAVAMEELGVRLSDNWDIQAVLGPVLKQLPGPL